MIHLTIGPINLSIEGIEKEELPVNTLLFLSDNEHSDIHYQIKIEAYSISLPKKIVYRKNDLIVFQKDKQLESRLLFLPNSQNPYAYYDEEDDNHISVYFNPYFKRFLSSDTIFHSLLALERHLYKYNAFVYHCAYLDFNGDAYLFSGPSGIGKTTHSDIWCKMFPNETKVLNGDKCLLIKDGDGFYALGWPVCGSSGICFNERRKVDSIVLLQQTPDNQELFEKKINQFKRILEQLTVNYWNPKFVSDAMFFAEQLIGKITCCTYGCNISNDAVTTLYEILKNKKYEENKIVCSSTNC